jgi:hypothetical protein
MFLSIWEQLDLRMVKRCLIALVGVVCVAIAADQARWMMRPGTAQKAMLQAAGDEFLPGAKEALEPPEVFREAAAKRNLFHAAEGGPEAGDRTAGIRELVKDYRLKGIALFAAPEGIIEDAATGRTVFVKAGEWIGEVAVKEIKEESVVLSRGGEEVELKIQGGEIR